MARLTKARDATRVQASLAACAIVGIGLLIAVAATVDPLAPPTGEPGVSLAVRLPGPARTAIVMLLTLSTIILLALQRPRRRTKDEPESSRESRRRPAWAAVMSLLLPLLALVYLAWFYWSPGDGQPIDRALTAIADLLDLLARSRKPSASAPLFDALITMLSVMAALAIFALILLIALADRLEKWWAGRAAGDAAPPLREAVAESLDDLRVERDARVAIIRVYRRFEHALSTARVPRAPWQTPSEFMRAALARLPLPGPPIERLTSLFEIARFSDRHLGATARDTACDSLEAIEAALEHEAPHAR